MLLDIWFIKETDYCAKEEFLRTINVSKNTDIQEIRRILQNELNHPINLKIYRTRYVSDTHHSFYPQAPSLLLVSNTTLTLETLYNKIPTNDNQDYLSNDFRLELLPKVKIIAFD